MFKYPILLLAVVSLAGCGAKQYKDDPVLAAQIKARKAAEKAAREAPPQPYAAVEVTETPQGHILYNCSRGRAVTMWGLTIGGEPQRLSIHRTGRASPDGRLVLLSYFGDKTNRFELGVQAATGGDIRDVAASADHDSISGAWSPDGRTIAFSSYRDGDCGIYTVPVAGGEVRRITPEHETADQPAYSPDGNYLAYVVTYRHPTTRDWVRDLRVMKLDGAGQRTLVKAKKQIVGVDWSPGGQWLVFGCNDAAQSDLCIVDINGNGFHKITNDPYGDTDPNWLAFAGK